MKTHEQQIKDDIDLYGVAYERLLPDGTIERLDPVNIRVINPKRPGILFYTYRNFWDWLSGHKTLVWKQL